MKRVAGVLKVERRAATRHQVTVRVLYVVGGCVLEAQTADVSETGIRLHTEVELEVGTELFLYLEPREQEKAPRIEAKVVWSKKDGESFQCGVHFGPLSDNAQVQIREITAALAPSNPLDAIPEAEARDVIEVHESPPPAAATQPMVGPPASPAPNPLGATGPARSSATATGAAAEGPLLSPARLEAAVNAEKEERLQRLLASEKLVAKSKELAAVGQTQEAVRTLEEALQKTPDSLEAVEELARLLYLTGEVSEAAAMFDRALNIKQEKG